MSNLLQIETAFIANIRFDGGSLNQLHNAQDAERDSRKKLFDNSLKQALHIKLAYAWFESEEGKTQMESAGITWNKSEFVEKALRYKARTTPDLLVRIQNRIEEFPAMLTQYKREQTRLANAGETAPRSIQHFDKWSRAILDEAEATGVDVEEVVESTEVEATESATSTQLAQFRFKHPMYGNIVVNMAEDGSITTTNSESEILESLEAFKHGVGQALGFLVS